MLNQALDHLSTLLAGYSALPNRPALHAVFRQQIRAGENLWDRKNYTGHLTATAIVLDASQSKFLAIHHKSLNIWIGPGGHCDPFETPLQSARRELLEETGLAATLHPWHQGQEDLPFEINTHEIPARPEKNEAAHLHHDLRYVFVANVKPSLTLATSEALSYDWKPLKDLVLEYPDMYERVPELNR